MSLPSYTVYGNHPRLFFRDTDKTAIVARTNDAAGWKDRWDARDGEGNLLSSTILGSAQHYLGHTDAANVQTGSPHGRLMVLALAGYVEETDRPIGGYKDKAILAAIYLAGLADTVSPTDKKFRLLALALVFDILYADTTTDEKNILAAEIIQQCDRMAYHLDDAGDPDEYMDGHSANEQMCQLAGALAIHGYSTYAAQAQTRLTEALTFFFGAGSTDGALAMERYQFSNGGSEKGSWYIYLDLWHAIFGMTMLKNGTNLDSWTDETSWASRCWEWFLWTGWRGGVDDDYEAMGDTAKVDSPLFHQNQRFSYGALMTQYPTPNSTEGGRHLRWLYDQYDALATYIADDTIWDILLMNRAAVTSVAPSSGSPVPSATRMFAPPGVWYARRAGRDTGYVSWNYDQSVVFRISARSRYYLGHPHLDAGSVQIRFKDDVLLLAPAGYYDAYGSSHHMAAYQRTWLQSMAPCIYDPAQVYERWSDTVINDGGQHFKKWVDPTETDPRYVEKSDPYTPYKMLNDAGGEAWKRTERFEQMSSDSTATFLVAELTPSYVKFHTDTNRLEVCTVKYLLIEPTAANGLVYPALLYYARIRKRSANASNVVTIPMHFRHTATARSYGLDALGYRSEVGTGSPGRLWVDVRDIGSCTLTIVGPGTPLNAQGYGPTQFQVLGSGTNYPPSSVSRLRQRSDLKRYSAYLRHPTPTQEEHFVCLLMPTAAGDSEPVSSRAWVTDVAQPDWYGITLGTSTYLIHRIQDLATYGAPDTTPCAEVTNLTVQEQDQRLIERWTNPTDADYSRAQIYYRTSAIAP
ncbi:MAG: hypothetical protein V2A73_12225 [Pseudomonadota bacterium]